MMARTALATYLLQLVAQVNVSVSSDLSKPVDQSAISLQAVAFGPQQGRDARCIGPTDQPVPIESELEDRQDEGVALECD